jgi:hypothetical protein
MLQLLWYRAADATKVPRLLRRTRCKNHQSKTIWAVRLDRATAQCNLGKHSLRANVFDCLAASNASIGCNMMCDPKSGDPQFLAG